VSRVVYGSIIGLAEIVAVEAHPPRPMVVAGTLLATAVAVALAELYSESLGARIRTHGRVRGADARHIAGGGAAVAFGIAFPAVFFALAALGVVGEQSAFTLAKWTGLALIGFYGFCAARLGGATVTASLVDAAGVVLIGAGLIGLKAVLH
jgi:hypothetical protein